MDDEVIYSSSVANEDVHYTPPYWFDKVGNDYLICSHDDLAAKI